MNTREKETTITHNQKVTRQPQKFRQDEQSCANREKRLEEVEEDLQEDVIPRAVPSRAHRNKSSFKTKCELAEVETADEDHSATQCCNENLSTFFPLILISSHFDKNLFM